MIVEYKMEYGIEREKEKISKKLLMMVIMKLWK